MSALPKVLVLHGYTQSATIFNKRMGAIRKSVAKDVELVFMDAPIVLYPADIVATFGSTSLEALGSGEADNSDPALQPRAWWKSNAARTESVGIEESILALRDVLRKDRYEAVWGFSQGAAMAAMLSALLEKPEVYPPFLVDGQSPHPPFKYCIAVAGFRVPGPLANSVFDPPYKTPTLHVLGRTDIIVAEERAKTLLDVSEGKRVVWHDGGHFVPSKGPWRNFFRDFLKDPLGAVPAPGEGGASGSDSAPQSTATSGAATPVPPGGTTPGGSEISVVAGALLHSVGPSSAGAGSHLRPAAL